MVIVGLGEAGQDADLAVPALVAALKDKEWQIRQSAAVALKRIGPEAKSAVSALFEACEGRGLPCPVCCH